MRRRQIYTVNWAWIYWGQGVCTPSNLRKWGGGVQGGTNFRIISIFIWKENILPPLPLAKCLDLPVPHNTAVCSPLYSNYALDQQSPSEPPPRLNEHILPTTLPLQRVIKPLLLKPEEQCLQILFTLFYIHILKVN
jgi:hypothetical protein